MMHHRRTKEELSGVVVLSGVSGIKGLCVLFYL